MTDSDAAEFSANRIKHMEMVQAVVARLANVIRTDAVLTRSWRSTGES